MRSRADAENPADSDSVCLDEISYAQYELRLPIVPVMARLLPDFITLLLNCVQFPGKAYTKKIENDDRGIRQVLQLAVSLLPRVTG